MKTQTASLLLALTLAPLGAAQACDAPVAPPSPDGGSSTLEEMIAYINEDELVEVTPQSLRLRKIYLKEHERKSAARQAAKAEG